MRQHTRSSVDHRHSALWGAVIVLLLVAGPGASGVGWAAELHVRPAAILEVGTSALCPYHSIETAIAAANPGDTVKVENTVFIEDPLSINKNLTLAGGYNSAHPYSCLTLTGLNHTTLHLSGPSVSRMIAVYGATVTMSWFIVEGNTGGGGGLSVTDGTLNLDNVLVDDNSGGWGGGLAVFRSIANLNDCQFNDNWAFYGGGGIDAWGASPSSQLNLTRVVFRRNQTGGSGGALLIEQGAQVQANDRLEVGVDGTTINRAALDGGGICLLGGSALVVNASSTLSTIASNTAERHGGGIYADNSSVTLNGVIDPQFGERLMVSSNEADYDGDGTGDGGGIYATNGSTVSAAATFFYNNEAQNGGSVYATGSSTFDANDVRVMYSTAAHQGGGLWLGGGSTAVLANGSEVGDWGSIDPNDADEGGGLYATGGASVTVHGSAVRGNYGWVHGAGACVMGGATLSVREGSVIARNETPYGCDEGGGIYAGDAGTRVTLDASQVMTNSAIIRGGGLYVGNGATATVRTGSVIWNNETFDFTGGGAGAYVAGTQSRLEVEQGTFRDNWSSNMGGGIYNAGGAVTLDGASIGRNHAYSNGGGLFNDSGSVSGQGAWISYNDTQAGQGGGLYSLQGTVNLEGAGIYLNSASASGGGAIATWRTALTLARSHVAGNSAAGEGSALHISGVGAGGEPVAFVQNNFLVDNDTLPLKGPPGCCSAVYVELAAANLRHNTIARQEQAAFGVYAGDGSQVWLTDNIVSNFVVGIRRPSGGTGYAEAWYTLYYNNMFDYDPDVFSYNPVYGDPAFVVPGDYHLDAGSAAIDAGVDAGLSEDFDGDARPLGSGFDIGADEYPLRLFLPLIQRHG